MHQEHGYDQTLGPASQVTLGREQLPGPSSETPHIEAGATSWVVTCADQMRSRVENFVNYDMLLFFLNSAPGPRIGISKTYNLTEDEA